MPHFGSYNGSTNVGFLQSRRVRAFTLLELLVATSIIAILATMMTIGVRKSKSKARTIVCENNFRQLAVTWALYAGDNAERLASNVHLDLSKGWVRGILSPNPQHSDNTNTLFLTHERFALFAPYLRDPGPYRCPQDRSAAIFHGRRYPRVRSCSMSQAVGYESDPVWLPSKKYAQPGELYYRTYRLSTDFRRSADTWVFIDESLAINDIAFAVEMPAAPYLTRWIDVPARRHGRAATLSFADGHVEAHRWQSTAGSPETYSPNNPDILWLSSRTSEVIGSASKTID